MSEDRRVRQAFVHLLHRFRRYRKEWYVEQLQAGEKPSKRKPGEKDDLAQFFYPHPETDNKKQSSALKWLREIKSGEKKLTASDLVHLLSKLQQNSSEFIQNRLDTSEVSFAIQRLIQLSPEEKEQIGKITRRDTFAGDREILLQQALLNIRLYYADNYLDAAVLDLYNVSLGLNFARQDKDTESFLNYLNSIDEEHQPKIKGALRSILLKSGTRPVYLSDGSEDYVERYFTVELLKRLEQTVKTNQQLRKEFPIYIRTVTVENVGPFPALTSKESKNEALINNELLSLDELEAKEKNDFLSSKRNVATLASRHSYRVTVGFRVKFKQKKFTGNFQKTLDERYSPFDPMTFQRLKHESGDEVYVDFSVSSSGVGGNLSQVIKIINIVLFSDIPCLSDYFPVAHDVMITQSIVGNNVASPVWAHSLVALCESEALGQAMQKSAARGRICPYGQVSFADTIGRGDYCEFDLLLCVARSALQARLQAIRATGVAPDGEIKKVNKKELVFDSNGYLQDLCHRVEQGEILREARRLTSSYPFSSLAQEGHLKSKKLINSEYPENTPFAVYDAHLTIIETFLQEGAYRSAYDHLQALRLLKREAKPDPKNIDELSREGFTWLRRYRVRRREESGAREESHGFTIFSGTLLIRYELSRAAYYYLLDIDNEPHNSEYRGELKDKNADHNTLIRDYVWESLDRAEDHISARLAKYLTINEFSQATFHPHYQLLAKIYFLRAKLMIFFPNQVPIRRENGERCQIPTDEILEGTQKRTSNAIHRGRLYLLEKARVYAASDGETSLYVCYTAYQCWTYLIAAFSEESIGNEDIELGRDRCFEWAKRLRNEALQNYTDIGRQCYYQIKEKSGVEGSKHFGDCLINYIPAIREVTSYEEVGLLTRPNNQIRNDTQEDLVNLNLDMSLLVVRRRYFSPSGEPDEAIYMFGTQACYVLFARGIYHLCSNEGSRENASHEFDQASLDSLKSWDEKLKIAHRLLTYAWAIADEGCKAEVKEVGDKGASIEIRRHFERCGESGDDMKIYEANVTSVKELYPARTTEIASLARVFATACLVLRQYTSKEKSLWCRDVSRKILDETLSEQKCFILKGQKCYDSHLREYLTQCQVILEQELQNVQLLSQASHRKMNTHRDRIIRSLFNALHT